MCSKRKWKSRLSEILYAATYFAIIDDIVTDIFKIKK